MQNKNNILFLISKNRNLVMGIAILWIVFYHSQPQNLPLFIKFPLFSIGFGGVDIFLFLSGFGIYYSLNNNNDEISFYKRRIKRLLPVLPITILYIFSSNNLTFHQAIGYLTQQDFWVPTLSKPPYGFWYISAICMFYFISPILVNIIKKHCYSLKNILIFLFIPIFLSIPYWGTSILIATLRLPIYILGLIFGFYYCNNYKITDRTKNIFYIGGIFAFLSLVIMFLFLKEEKFTYGLIRYPFIILAPALTMFFAEISTYINTYIFKFILASLNYLGKISLEIYLIDTLLLALYNQRHLIFPFYAKILFSIIIGICYAIIYKQFQKIFYMKEN